MERTCTKCAKPIDPERLEALPDTLTCKDCSTTIKAVTLMDFGHKTAPVLVTIDPKDKEGVRRAQRAYRRAR